LGHSPDHTHLPSQYPALGQQFAFDTRWRSREERCIFTSFNLIMALVARQHGGSDGDVSSDDVALFRPHTLFAFYFYTHTHDTYCVSTTASHGPPVLYRECIPETLNPTRIRLSIFQCPCSIGHPPPVNKPLRLPHNTSPKSGKNDSGIYDYACTQDRASVYWGIHVYV
jgi:hypothetical protein